MSPIELHLLTPTNAHLPDRVAVHPDKPPTFWINEVGVDDAHQKQGIGKQLMHRLLEHGRSLGCTQSWVATEMDNTAARCLYVTCGGRQDKNDAVVYWFPME